MSENIQMICKINNRAKETLRLKSADLNWGKFDDSPNQYPVKAIEAKRTADPAFRSSGRQGSASGTEGTVIYQLGDNADAWIKIYWDVPWAPGASNSVNTETFDPDVAASVDGFAGHGAVESVTINIIDGR